MNLIKQKSIRHPDDFPTLQLFLLAIVRLAEPIALTSIFPYAWQLVKRFQVGNEQDASTYSGLLISSFALAEALMGMFWGGVSDRIGRKPVLLFGCAGTMISMLVLGFASNIWVAVIGRVFGGALNGNIGVIQTMVGELVKKPEHTNFVCEARAYSIMPLVWSVGTILGPCIGGTFADPHETWPDVFPRGSLLDRFPYLLPNLICAGLLLVSIVLGVFLLEETHHDMGPRTLLEADGFISEQTPLRETSDAIKRPVVDARSPAYGTFVNQHPGAGDATEKSQKSVAYSIFSNRRIMAIVISLSIYTYHAMCFDHLLPIFFEDDRAALSESISRLDLLYFPGGLGLPMNTVGVIMAFNGIIALFIQAVIFPLAAHKIGVYRLFLLVTILHPIAYFMMPLLVWVPESLLYPALYVSLTVRDLFSIIVYPLLLILLKDATPSSSMLGKVNGFAASAGAACRMVAPPVAGVLYTIGSRMDCTALAWWGSAAAAIVGAFQCFSVEQTKAVDHQPGDVESLAPPAKTPPNVTITALSDDVD